MAFKTLIGMAAGLAAAVAGVEAPTQAQAQAPLYKVTKSVALGAPDRWDYVVYDAPSHRVYVAHGDRVSVVDGRDGKTLGEVVGMPGGTHGIGVSHDAGKGFTDDGKAGVAVPFDLKTLQIGAPITAMPDADGIASDPFSGHVFVVNGDSKTLTVIDPKAGAAIASIDLGGGLEYAVADGAGKLYVNGAERRELVRVDTRTNAVDARWPIPDCASPHGLALDPAGRRAFMSCINKLMTVVDMDSGAVVAAVPIGAGTDSAAFDPKRKRVFSANGEGTLSVIQEKDPQTFVSLGEVKTAATGRTMGIDPDSGRLYIAAADIDPQAPVAPLPDGRPGRPKPLPGTLKLLFLDPTN